MRATRKRNAQNGESPVDFAFTESRDPSGEEYGAERLELAALAHERRPGRGILTACLADLTTFRRGVRTMDDQTLLVLNRVGGGK